LLFVPNGSTFTIRYFAEQMIQRSDNTATDHLLFLLGRENVEHRIANMGRHDPALNISLLSTREFAVIKFLWTDEELAIYLVASTAQRRVMIAKEQRGYEALEAYVNEHGDQIVPARIDTAEWNRSSYSFSPGRRPMQLMGYRPPLPGCRRTALQLLPSSSAKARRVANTSRRPSVSSSE
jgi:hypothetical protein